MAQASDVYYKAALEAMLFASGEAVEAVRLALALEITTEEAAAFLNELVTENSPDKGIEIIKLEDKYQLRTNPSYYPAVKSLMKLPEKKSLTTPLLETLAIIAYKQPVTKPQIEDIRGLSADHAVNRLLELGFVCESGRLDAPGRPVIFATTDDFLRRFGIASLHELPDAFVNIQGTDIIPEE